MTGKFRFQPLEERHNRAAFTCSGDEGAVLQEYLRNDSRALREHRRNVTTVWIMTCVDDPQLICGFFTLSTATIELEAFPAKSRRGLPLYRPMPALKLGRMAVDDRFRGRDAGTLMLHEAYSICLRLRRSVGFVALLVDAKSDPLIEYYEQRGFSRFPERSRSLFLTQATMAQIVGA